MSRGVDDIDQARSDLVRAARDLDGPPMFGASRSRAEALADAVERLVDAKLAALSRDLPADLTAMTEEGSDG